VALERVLPADELWDGEMRGAIVRGRRVLLVKVEGKVCAYEDRCAHLGLPVSDGRLENGVITCRAHSFQYDAGTGRGVNPRSVCLHAFPVTAQDGWVSVDVEGKG
jgi:toluene monooxygenase system ferredoxin subunit